MHLIGVHIFRVHIKVQKGPEILRPMESRGEPDSVSLAVQGFHFSSHN